MVNLSWETPAQIPGFVDTGLDPVIVTDSNGAVHLFNSQLVGDDPSIFYIRWTLQDGWSNLVDVITSPRAGARVYGACIDQQGWIHLTFFGGDDLYANFYYTKAPLINAGKTTAWSEPLLIGEAAITPSMGALICDEQGFLQVIYSGKVRGNGLYAIQSFDDGVTWDAPQPIFLTYNSQLWPFALKMLFGKDGHVYATWSVVDATGNGQKVYFAKQESDHTLWSEPTLIDKVSEYEVDTPALVEYDDTLLLTYHNGFPTTQWMRTSQDGGDTWSRAMRLFSHVGGNGPASYAIDSSNTLHMFFGGRVGEPAIHGAWHSIWSGERWNNPEGIESGRQRLIGLNGEEGFDPTYLQAAVSQGNLIFVIWRHDPMAGPINFWYTYRIINSPQLPAQTLQSPDVEMITKVSPTPDLVLTDTPIRPTSPVATETSVIPGETAQQTSDIYSPNINLALGLSAVIGLMVIVIVFQYIRNNR